MAVSAAACSGGVAVTLIVVHLLRPDLDASWRPVSEYALGAHGWLMTLAFACWGLGPIALALAVRQAAATRGAKVGVGLLVLGGVGPLLAAMFPMDPLLTPPAAMTRSGMVHAAAAVLGDLVPIGALVLTTALTRPQGPWARVRKTVRASAWAAFGLLVVATAAMAALMPDSGQLGPEVKVGWLMRAYILASNGWVGVGARAALRSPAEP
jgi:hypothetical protein